MHGTYLLLESLGLLLSGLLGGLLHSLDLLGQGLLALALAGRAHGAADSLLGDGLLERGSARGRLALESASARGHAGVVRRAAEICEHADGRR
jgi:hypothetical protein